MDSAWNLFNLNGRDRFDSRPALIRTFTEAAQWINSAALPLESLNEKRNRIHLLYAEDPPFYLSWRISPNRNDIIGIGNYDENARPNLLLQKGVENFIIEKLNDEETTGILAMDRLAFRVISKFKDLLNTKYLHYFLAIRKDIVHDLSLTAVP